MHHTFSYVTNHKTVVCTALLRCERWCAQHFCVVAITNCWCAQHLPACSLEVASACTAFCVSIKFAHVIKCWCAQHLPAWLHQVVSVCTAFCVNTKFAHVIKCWCAQHLPACSLGVSSVCTAFCVNTKFHIHFLSIGSLGPSTAPLMRGIFVE